MKSIKSIYKVGPGPSSSHTIAPYNAAIDFKNSLKKYDKVVCTLYGSLALTGKGHGTDKILKVAFDNKKIDVLFDKTFKNLEHPNKLIFDAYLNNEIISSQVYFSIGGGDFTKDLKAKNNEKDIYPFKTFDGLKNFMKVKNITDMSMVCDFFEDNDMDEFLSYIFEKVCDLVEKNLQISGILPGKLGIKRVAKELFNKSKEIKDDEEKRLILLTAFAYSASEGNANGDIVVTCPTCGSCGIIPSLIYYEYKYKNIEKKKIINGLKVAGLIASIIKENASLSGAVHGCQAEIGSASSMGAALLCYLHDLNIYQIEYASEVALEHFLGLTCDPVDGYVQIPCIERNGIGAIRSYVAYLYAKDIAILRENKVSFDECIKAMRITGESLSKDYKETGIGGLAKIKK